MHGGSRKKVPFHGSSRARNQHECRSAMHTPTSSKKGPLSLTPLSISESQQQKASVDSAWNILNAQVL
jgi:hypothetical protein